MNPESKLIQQEQHEDMSMFESLVEIATFEGSLAGFSSDGNWVCLASPGGDIEIRKVSDLSSEGKKISNNKLWSSAFDKENNFVLATSQFNTITVANEAKNTSQSFEVPDNVTTSVPLSEDGRFLAAVCKGGDAFIFDTLYPDDIVKFDQPEWKYGQVYFSDSGNFLATQDQEDTVSILSRESRKEVQKIKSSETKINTVSFSSEDTMFAVGTRDGKVGIGNIETGEFVETKINVDDKVTQLDFINDESVLVISGNGRAGIYNIESGLLITPLPFEKVWGVQISKDGSKVASYQGYVTKIYEVSK